MRDFELRILKDTLAVCRLDSNAPVPQWAAGEFVTVTRTQSELSIVCAQINVPDGIRSEDDWRAIQIEGTLDFTMIGIIASVTKTLAASNISVFAVSTFDTDYFLVKQNALSAAISALVSDGYRITHSND